MKNKESRTELKRDLVSLSEQQVPSPKEEKEEYLSLEGGFWPDGWFLHSKGQISGPYLAKELFLAPKVLQDTANLVSRKGFKRWYRVDFLAGAYAQKNPPDPSPAPSPAPLLMPSREQTPPLAKPQPKNERSIAYRHMMLRGRLRLGSLPDPWFMAFILTPLSLGLYWPIWYRRLSGEIAFHMDTPGWHGPKGVEWATLLPVWHFVKVYRLARQVLQMEVQNRYVGISPVLAVVLSIIPPLAMVYIQTKVNQHWLLHIRHQKKSS